MSDLTLSSGLYKIASCIGFALINLMIKTLALPASQIACFENLLAGTMLWALTVMHRPLPPSPHWPMAAPLSKRFKDAHWQNFVYWVRALLALISSWLWVMGVQKLPLLQSVSMGFLGPFVTLVGARLFLRERLTFWRILAIFLACLGGIFISIGGKTNLESSSVLDPWVLAPLIASVLFAVTNLMSKSLLTQTSSLVLTRSLMMTTGLGLLTVSYGDGYSHWVMPSLDQWGPLTALGLLAAGAHMCSHLAMARSDIVALLPLGIFRFILSGLLGWFFLQETPSLGLICGIILAIGASRCLSWHSKK